MSIRIPIFTQGRHTAMNGVTRDYTQLDLQATAQAYDPAVFQAPVVLGHPEHNHPAWGWVKAVSFDDGMLWAELDELDADFVEWVRQGRYKKISASFYLPDSPVNPKPGVLYLRHIGFLGAVAPALKNLPTVALPMDLAEADGVEVFESANLKQSGQPSPQPSPDGRGGFSESNKENPMSQKDAANDLQAQLDALKAENAALKEQATHFQEQAQSAQTALEEQKRNAVHAEHAAFCEKLVIEGRMLPANKLVAVAALDLIASQETPLQFGEGDSKAPLTVDTFKAALAANPVVVPFGELTKDTGEGNQVAKTVNVPLGYEVDPQSAELHRKALAYQEAHAGCDYVTAVMAVGAVSRQ